MPVNEPVIELTNKQRAAALRAQGLTMKQIGHQLGVSAPAVCKMLKTVSTPMLPLAKVEAAQRTLAELAESTRAALAETFDRGAIRARRRIIEVQDSNDDAAAKTVLETAKLATEGAAKVHGWGDTNGAGSGGRVAIGLIGELRSLKQAQVVEVESVPNEKAVTDDSVSHPKATEQAENQQKQT